MAGPELALDPALVEEAVFQRARSLEAAGDALSVRWHREREARYALPVAERPRAFAALALEWFERLELARPFTRALARVPEVLRAVREIRLERAVRARDEGSELYRDGAVRRFVLTVLPARFLDKDALHELCLRELLYAQDMLAPAFGYVPELRDAGEGPAQQELVRDRLRVLWAARVAGRVARELGASPPPVPREFTRAFAGVLGPEECAALHARASGGELDTFAALLGATRALPVTA
jgi:hypothetical protein